MKILNYFAKLIELVAILFFCLMLISTFIQVISRYFFTPITWTEEIARYSYVWLVFVGSIVIQKNDEHIRLDLLGKKFIDKYGETFEIIFKIFLLYICYQLTVSGYKFSITMGKAMSTILPMPLKYLYIVIPISFGLIFIFTVVQLFDGLIAKRKEFNKNVY